MKKILFASLLPVGALAQNPVVPVLNTPIPDLEVCGQEAQRTIELSEHFGTEEIRDTAVRLKAEWFYLDGQSGTADLDFLLFRNITPVTVTNFLGYVNRGDYENMVVHRLVKDFVVQGGGFTVVQGADGAVVAEAVPTQPPIVNEFGVSNTLATISMAKLGGNPNSATSQWFVSTGANSDNLDVQNEGFAVFGRVSQATFPNVVALNDGVEFSLYNLGGAFVGTPLVKGTPTNEIAAERFYRFSSATEIPLPPDQAGTDTGLTYSIISQSGDGVVTTAIEEGRLVIDFADSPNAGTATLVVEAEDSVGNLVADTFRVIKQVNYAEWRADHFGGPDLADDGISGPMADPDSDGVNNYSLFVLGLPVSGDQRGAVKSPDLELRATNLILKLEVSLALCEVDFTVEESPDLDQWSPVAGAVESLSRVGDRDVVRFTVPRTSPAAASSYYRIRFAPLVP